MPTERQPTLQNNIHSLIRCEFFAAIKRCHFNGETVFFYGSCAAVMQYER